MGIVTGSHRLEVTGHHEARLSKIVETPQTAQKCEGQVLDRLFLRRRIWRGCRSTAVVFGAGRFVDQVVDFIE